MVDLRTEAGGWLHPAEIDLLCTFGEVAPPYPLRVRSLGASMEDQRDVFRTARSRLAERGLADHRGPRGVAADFVHLLREGAGALDMLVARKGSAARVLVLARREEALLVNQNGAEGPVHLRALSLHDAVDQLQRLVPEHEAAMAAPFSVPRRAVEQVHREILGARDRLSADDLDRIMQRNGLDEQTARKMATHLQPVLGNGQAGVAVRRGYADEWTRSGEELRWLDTTRGRFRLAGGTLTDWMSVNPFTRDELRSELRTLAGELWY
ncbi:ESX secretion-associated protein EspG [Alloactinosynnema sp. L-07]|uniref:ESX secretion-associated protein EspG n=1 Tax=Alloactinosynnema sp. L-07 TaxID=1653480 RepID=UPI0015603A83|nr:ESX secretion-associated protein EspG [Alloactinosynnema sp. L-07]